MFSKKLATLVAASMVVATTPALAQPAAQALNPSASLRASADLGGESQLGEGSGGLWAGLIGVALLAAFVLVALDVTDSDGPVSP